MTFPFWATYTKKKNKDEGIIYTHTTKRELKYNHFLSLFILRLLLPVSSIVVSPSVYEMSCISETTWKQRAGSKSGKKRLCGRKKSISKILFLHANMHTRDEKKY